MQFAGRLGKNDALNIEPWTPNYEQVKSAEGGQMKQPYVDFGTDRLKDNEKYYSAETLAKEWDLLLTKTWHIVGHLNDIPEEHCNMKVDLGRESFIVVRGQGELIRAFYNVCQHRGTRLVKEDFGRTRVFTCPYHNWSFKNDGEVAHIPGRETFREETLCRNLNLEPVRVDTWKGWVFINMDMDAEPLNDYLGERFRESLDAFEYRKFIRVYDVRQTWNVNWKAAIEAFIEGYHVTAVHWNTLCAVMDDYYVQHDIYENGQGRTIFPFMQPAQSYLRSVKGQIDEISPEMKHFLLAAGVAEEDFPADWHHVKAAVIAGKRKNQEKLGFDYSRFTDDQLVDDWNISFFPLATFNTHPEGVLFQRWWPDAIDPHKTHYSLQVYAMVGDCTIPTYMPIAPGADPSGKEVLPAMRLEGMGGPALGPVVEEDVAFIPQFQAGIESRGFKGATYGEQEIRNRQFYSEYYRYMNKSR